MADDYPKYISSSWVGVPNDIDAALRWNSKTYFFKGDFYYRLNDATRLSSGNGVKVEAF